MRSAAKLANSARFLRQVVHLSLPYFNSGERWKARGLLAAIVALNLAAVYMLVLLNEWNRVFYDALQNKDAAVFWAQLGRFTYLAMIFIVIAVGAGRGMLWPASLGALAACALVLVIGAIAHRPLSKVPENTLKFGVGVMLSAFGVFWTGEGLGVEWPGHDLALFVFAALFLVAGLMSARMVRQPVMEVRP